MRYAVLADIHGNLPALEAVLADISTRAVDRVLVAGDLAAGCPFPRETLALLRSSGCACIRGNNDTYLLKMRRGLMPGAVMSSLAWGATRWTYARLDEQDLDWIEALPAQLSLDGAQGGLRLVHGSPRRESEGLVPDRDPAVVELMRRLLLLDPGEAPLPLAQVLDWIPERVLVCGHYHVPWLQREGERLVFNPGSCGVSTHGDPRACYALLTGDGGEWQVELRALDYDISRCARAFDERGLIAEGGAFARAYRLDVERAGNIVVEFLVFAAALARARGLDPQPVIPDAAWVAAERSFAWPD